ncbi:calcium activated cation channel [Meredithblackwellia eburnea MCA 4105]
MSPVSSILTKEVVTAFSKIGGDFSACVPFALLEARRHFHRAVYDNPSDSDENQGRKVACEALARKIVALTPMEKQYELLSSRYSVIDSDGDDSIPVSVLESAVDQHATFFLSSNEAQRCVFAVWRGLLVPEEQDDGSIVYAPYRNASRNGSIWDRFDPSRVGVPRYQFFFRIALWVVFIVAYTAAIQTPERGFGVEDIILYVQLLGYLLEDVVKIYKIGAWSAFGFWTSVNFIIYTLLTIAFVYRIMDITTHDVERSNQYRMLCFQFLSSASPLIWMKLLTIFDLFQYFGTLQIVVWRMLKESAVFFTLLGLLAIGFGQALTGLDVADSSRDSTESVIHSLIQGLLGSPAFDLYDKTSSSYPFGMVLYYGWSVLTLVILLNILVALFGSAYAECTDEAVPTFLAFFSGKTVSAIRAPDTYVYAAPFNLIEVAILPLELVLSKSSYATLNRYLMGALFFIPLTCIALFESYFDASRLEAFRNLTQEADEYSAADEDPEPCSQADEHGSAEPEGMKISTVPFSELKKALPSLTRSTEGEILWEIKALRSELADLRKKVEK